MHNIWGNHLSEKNDHRGRNCFVWLKAAASFALILAVAQLASAAPVGNAQNGKKLFATVGCATCHGEHAEGNMGPQISPPPFPLQQFQAFVRAPTGMMRPFSKDAVSDTQLADIYAFLVALSKTPPAASSGVSESGKSASSQDAANPSSDVNQASGNAENGKKLFNDDGCYECHGHAAEGGSAGPRIGNPPPVSLQGLIDYVCHPSGQMPPFTSKVISDQELTDIYAFLKSLPKPQPAKDIPLLNH